MGLLTDEQIKYEVEHAFDEELWIDHKPTPWELELYVYKKVLKAHLTELREVVDGAEPPVIKARDKVAFYAGYRLAKEAILKAMGEE